MTSQSSETEPPQEAVEESSSQGSAEAGLPLPAASDEVPHGEPGAVPVPSLLRQNGD